MPPHTTKEKDRTRDVINTALWITMGLGGFFALLFGGSGAWETRSFAAG